MIIFQLNKYKNFAFIKLLYNLYRYFYIKFTPNTHQSNSEMNLKYKIECKIFCNKGKNRRKIKKKTKFQYIILINFPDISTYHFFWDYSENSIFADPMKFFPLISSYFLFPYNIQLIHLIKKTWKYGNLVQYINSIHRTDFVYKDYVFLIFGCLFIILQYTK